MQPIFVFKSDILGLRNMHEEDGLFDHSFNRLL